MVVEKEMREEIIKAMSFGYRDPTLMSAVLRISPDDMQRELNELDEQGVLFKHHSWARPGEPDPVYLTRKGEELARELRGLSG